MAVCLMLAGDAFAGDALAAGVPADGMQAAGIRTAAVPAPVDFLASADVLSAETIRSGTTKPRKVLLGHDGVTAHAVFRDVDVVAERVRLDDGSFHVRLRDYGMFEVAAYRLAVLLGFDNVPPTVVRQLDRSRGSLQLWVNDAMTEKSRRERRQSPPDRQAWIVQMQAMFLFDYVIGNIDRHPGNYLMDADGKLWMIDHTRAFQLHLDDWTPEKLTTCPRPVWERLRAIDRAQLDARLGDVLSRFEIDGVERRIDDLVAHLQAHIAARGEANVILDAGR